MEVSATKLELSSATVLDLHSRYIAYLRYLERTTARRELVDQYEARLLADYKQAIAETPKEHGVPGLKLGNNSLYVTAYTYANPDANRKDPINLIWHNQGRPGNVVDILKNYVNPAWRNTGRIIPDRICADIQFVAVSTHPHFTDKDWIEMDASLSPQGCSLGSRTHLRAFGCPREPGIEFVTLGAVHHEKFKPPFGHKILAWDAAQDFLDQQFQADSGYVGIKSTAAFQASSEPIQGIQNDGIGSVIEIT